MKNKLLYIILIIVIIVGVIVYKVKGFNKELNYSNRQEFEISAASTFDVSKVEEIVKSIITNRKIKVQKVERFENAIEITSAEISEEEKENIINKINEEYNENISNEDVKITSVTATRIIDILIPYIFPIIIAMVIVLVYFVILYNKIGITEVLTKGIILPILAELSYYAIIVITRIPFGRITNSIALGIFILTIGMLTICFQKQKEKLVIDSKEEKENDE